MIKAFKRVSILTSVLLVLTSTIVQAETSSVEVDIIPTFGGETTDTAVNVIITSDDKTSEDNFIVVTNGGTEFEMITRGITFNGYADSSVDVKYATSGILTVTVVMNDKYIIKDVDIDQYESTTFFVNSSAEYDGVYGYHTITKVDQKEVGSTAVASKVVDKKEVGKQDKSAVDTKKDTGVEVKLDKSGDNGISSIIVVGCVMAMLSCIFILFHKK